MRHVMVCFAVTAAVLVSADRAQAQVDQQIQVANDGSDPNGWGYPASPGWYSPIATTGGALWINTGNGPVQYNLDADVNLQLKVQAPAPYGWTTLATMLLSDGTAKDDITAFYPDPGGFYSDNLPAIPGTNNVSGPNYAFNMQLYFWTGNYNTYGAAQAAAAAKTPGVYVADSGVFSQYVPYGAPPPIPMSLTGMPAMILSQNPVPLAPGDANGDGKVDINDLTIVLAHYGQSLAPGSWAEGDFIGDGTVDINDLTIVLAHYGQTAGSSAGELAAVPEPGAIGLLTAGMAGLLAWLARRAAAR